MLTKHAASQVPCLQAFQVGGAWKSLGDFTGGHLQNTLRVPVPDGPAVPWLLSPDGEGPADWPLCILGEFLTSRICPSPHRGHWVGLKTQQGWERPLSTPQTPKWSKRRRGGLVRKIHSHASHSRETGRGAPELDAGQMGAWLANGKMRVRPGEPQKEKPFEPATATRLGNGLRRAPGAGRKHPSHEHLLSACCTYISFSSQQLCEGGGICSHLTEEKTEAWRRKVTRSGSLSQGDKRRVDSQQH